MFKFSAGRYASQVKRKYDLFGSSPLTLSAVADSIFVEAGLYDGRCDLGFKPAALPTNYTITFDANLIPNGDGELTTFPVAPAPQYVTSGTGAAIGTNTGTPYAGSRSLQLSGAGGITADSYVDIPVHAGEALRLFSITSLRTGEDAFITVKNLQTGHWLKSDGTWQTSSQKISEDTTAAENWTTPSASDFNFVVETVAQCQGTEATLRITLSVVDVGSTTLDARFEVLLIPGADYMGAHGHTFKPVITPQAYADDDSAFGSATSLGTLSQDQTPVAFLVFASTNYERYKRLKLTGTADAIPSIGELVIAQLTSFTKNPDYPLDMNFVKPMARQYTPGGMPFTYPIGGREFRELRVQYTYKTQANYTQQRDMLLIFAQGTLYPLLFIPTETDTDTAIYGTLKELPIKFTRTAGGTTVPIRQAEYTIVELPFQIS